MRQMTYKFLNTIIDDLFAFVIKMPLMHVSACSATTSCFSSFSINDGFTRLTKRRQRIWICRGAGGGEEGAGAGGGGGGGGGGGNEEDVQEDEDEDDKESKKDSSGHNLWTATHSFSSYNKTYTDKTQARQ